MGCSLLLTMVALTYLFSRSKPVYLVNFHCYRPPDRRAPTRGLRGRGRSWLTWVALCGSCVALRACRHDFRGQIGLLRAKQALRGVCRMKMTLQEFVELSKASGVRALRPQLMQQVVEVELTHVV